ncbi:hypothetical protein DFH06DRAFT_920427, partial [Mycena polygramma]
LPVELIEQIINSAWHMPLSSSERITFMRSSALVNSTWADIFDLVSSRDVHVPSSSFCDHFIQRLRAQPPAAPSLLYRFLEQFRGPAKPFINGRSANLACQSLTIQIPSANNHPDATGRMRLPMGGVLDDLLEILDAHSLAPNLRRLSIEYMDAGFDDVFQRTGLAALPPQITHLELGFSFTDTMPLWLIESLRRKQEKQRYIGWIARSVTRLEVRGAGKNTVEDALRVCPN